ncbi:hypothetical protein QFC20_002535 [Naganishia adeliensis]|uniref:Uncharacterized protein n=1 Tax=Naganishia adeliensis TaxID=92952 RepID=A0ACC2WJG2_9TREE|nr:hypothetical protein QFC20_002535 [Naganishia adeliensis]
MAPVLKILHPKGDTPYPPVEPVRVNSITPIPIKTNGFDGEMSVWVKGFHGLENQGDGMEYFSEKGREGMTYGIVVRGRFLKPTSADDILFGNVFEKPIRNSLPWGTSIAMKFINSPTLASMNCLSIRKARATNGTANGNGHAKPANATVITEESYEGIMALREENLGNLSEEVLSASNDPSTDWGVGTPEASKARRKWLTNKENRRSLILDANWEIGMEFCNGLLDFNTLCAVLPQPFALRIPLLRYWDGQPATYICKARDESTVFWSMAFQIHKKDADDSSSEEESSDTEDETTTTTAESTDKGDDVD